MRVVVLNWCDYLGMGRAYVTRMRRMVEQWLSLPHTFVEVTEHDLPPGRKGWFNKLSLLEMFDGDVLYLDLDVSITGSLDPIVEAGRFDRSRIWARNDFSYPVTAGAKPVRDGYAGPLMSNGREATINSSVMFWSGRKVIDIDTAAFHGDQGVITRLFWPDQIGLLPDHLVRSFKYQADVEAPVTAFHGSPKPHEVPGWW